MKQLEGTFTVKELIDQGILEKPMDGNHGSYHPTSDEYIEEGIPFVMASDLENGNINLKGCKKISLERAKKLQKGFSINGDVLLTHKATIGRTAIVSGLNEDEFVMLTPQVTYYRIKNKNILDNRFLKYYFDSSEFQNLFQQWAGGGSTRAYLGITAQQGLPIKFPNIELQQKIVSIINPITKKIELNKKISRTLEAISQTIFKSWFVDFDPVHAKKLALDAGMSIDQAERAAMAIISGICSPSEFAENFKEKDKLLSQKLSKMEKDKVEELRSLASLFPSEFEESELGEIPKGWEVGTAESVADFIKSGGTPSRTNKDYWLNGNVPWLGSGEVRNRWITGSKEFITEEGLNRSSATLFPKYTTIVAMYGATAGEVGVSNFSLTTNQACCGIIPKKDYEAFNLFLFTSIILGLQNLANGAAQQNISQKVIKEYKLKLPNELLIKRFNAVAFPMLKNIFCNVEEINLLANLRDLLLPKLLSGEIDLSEVSID